MRAVLVPVIEGTAVVTRILFARLVVGRVGARLAGASSSGWEL